MLGVLTYLFYLLSKPNIPSMFVMWMYVFYLDVRFVSEVRWNYCISAFAVRLKVMRSTAPNAQMSKNQIPSPRGIVGIVGSPDTVGGALRLPEGAEDAYGLVLPISIFSAANGTV